MRVVRVFAPLLLLVAGCAGAGGQALEPGIVHGTIIGVGGPPGSPDHSIPGTVVVTASGRQVDSQEVAEGSEFRFSLKPGGYRLKVTGIGAGCEEALVTIESLSDRKRDLICRLK